MAPLFKSLLATLAVGAFATSIDYEETVRGLWDASDDDGDGELSYNEFVDACSKLGISESIFTSHSGSYRVIFNEFDGDGSGGLTPAEFAQGVNYPEYQQPLISAFTNGAGQVPTEIPMPSDDMVQARAVVRASVVITQRPSEIYPGMRTAITQYFADLAGVMSDAVIITFLTTADANAVGRRLSETSTTVDAKIFVDSEADAEAAALALNDANPSSASAFDGLNVESYEASAAPAVPPLPVANIIIIAAIAVILALFLCINACFWSKKKTNLLNQKGTGCCSTGCCSFNAVKPWAFGELVAAGIIIGTMVYLYVEIADLTNTILAIIDIFIEFASSTIDVVADMRARIPPGIISALEEWRPQLELLPISVLVPGLLAAAFLALGGVCPVAPGHKGSYCCTKFMVLIADAFLLLSFIFYITFCAFAIAILVIPDLEAQISRIRGICEVVPASVAQLMSDNQAAVDRLAQAGQTGADMDTLREQLDQVSELSLLLRRGCSHLNNFIIQLIEIFLPGLLCVVAVIFAMFVNKTLCCATGCCRGPPISSTEKAGKPAKAGKNKKAAFEIDNMQAV